MIDKFDDIARSTGAKIVSFCGHDSVPWDLMTFLAADKLKEKGDTLKKIEIFDEIKGGASGGTIETIFQSLEVSALYNARKANCGFDPLLKQHNTREKSESKTKPNLKKFLGYSSVHKSWIGFFVMSVCNSNVVKRSNVLLGYAPKLEYSEA